VPTLSVTTLISDLISEEIDVRQTVRRASLGSGEIVLLEVDVPEDAPIRMVSELRLPQPAILVTIVRGEKVLVPGARTEVRPGDEVLAVTRIANEKEVRAVLCEGEKTQGD
jgi:trk system potassium uptake protein TrkA